MVYLAWALFGIYIVATLGLALRGMQKTSSFASFALGAGDMGPLLVGITLASSIASSATFIINPGFVYKHGLSAFIHFAVASPLGFLTSLFVFSYRFREVGGAKGALTLPDWIGKRYNSPAMATYFAILNLLLSVSFVVLIVKGSALVMVQTLGLSYPLALFVIVGFVFSYIFMGGTYAHAYTNALQGLIMAGVAALIFFSGWKFLSNGSMSFFDQLRQIDPNLTKVVNPESALFGSFGSVFFASFIISFGLTCQPHILMKALYVKSNRSLTRALLVTVLFSVIYASILIAGFYARLSLGSELAQDAVMPQYVQAAFPEVVGIFVSIALLAAGMSTLDGILVGASTIAAKDIVLGPIGDRFLKSIDSQRRTELALPMSRYFLIGMGIVSFLIALNPPQLAGIFAQVGVYGLTAATIVPIAAGLYFPKVSSRGVFRAAVIGPLAHFAIYFFWKTVLGHAINPAVTASIGMAVALFTVVIGEVFQRNPAVAAQS